MNEAIVVDSVGLTPLEVNPPGPLILEMCLHPQRFIAERLPKITANKWQIFALLYVSGVAQWFNMPSVAWRSQMESTATWSRHWAYALAVAVVAGPASYLVTLVGFRIRVALSGGRIDTLGAGRYVLASSFVADALVVLAEVAKTFVYASPMAGLDDLRMLWPLSLPGAVIAAVLEYTAARTHFGVRRGRALFWFYGIVLIVVLVAMTRFLWPQIERLVGSFD